MVLYLIGLGLGSETDITVRGLELVRRCHAVFLEAYTSVLGVDKAVLEAYYGQKITEADRDTVEQQADLILVRPPAPRPPCPPSSRRSTRATKTWPFSLWATP